VANPIRIYWAIGNMKAMPGRTDRGELFESTCRAYAQSLVAPGTEVTIGWMKKAGTSYNSIFLSMLNDAHVVRDILDAEAAGYDAAMIGPHWDPGLYAAREAARIPVAGPCESAMMFAQTLGKRFAVVTTSDGIVPFIERNIRLYGNESRAISRKPVRPFGLGFDALVGALEGDGDEFLTRFTRTAQECIDDGADVILAGGPVFAPGVRPGVHAPRLHHHPQHRRAGGRGGRLRTEDRRVAGGAAARRRPHQERTAGIAVSVAERGGNRFGVADVWAAVRGGK